MSSPELPGISTRRNFLKAVAVLVPAFTLGSCSSSSMSRSAAKAPVYFTAQEKAFVDAASQRLIPTDSLGAGAKEADVSGFIDGQLAGSYGRASSAYMSGPFDTGTEQQGYQLPQTPAELYRTAIPQIESHCRDRYGNVFEKLDDSQKDEVLHALENGDIPFQGIDKKVFFVLLWQNVQEGFLSDPVYGGNRNFAGWKLIGFPGPRYNYVDDIGRFGQVYSAPFVSLGGRNPKVGG